jgi:hypothetical protein
MLLDVITTTLLPSAVFMETILALFVRSIPVVAESQLVPLSTDRMKFALDAESNVPFADPSTSIEEPLCTMVKDTPSLTDR